MWYSALLPLQCLPCFQWGFRVTVNIVVLYYSQATLFWQKPAGVNISESRKFCLGVPECLFATPSSKLCELAMSCVCVGFLWLLEKLFLCPRTVVGLYKTFSSTLIWLLKSFRDGFGFSGLGKHKLVDLWLEEPKIIQYAGSFFLHFQWTWCSAWTFLL